MDWLLYSDRSRFTKIPEERLFVLQGHMNVSSSDGVIRRTADITGEDWHIFLETSDFDEAWSSAPKVGIVVTESEMRSDPVLTPLLDNWRSGDDSTY